MMGHKEKFGEMSATQFVNISELNELVAGGFTFVTSFNLIQHHSQLDAHLFCGGGRGAVGIVKLPAPGLILDALFGSRFVHESMVFLSST